MASDYSAKDIAVLEGLEPVRKRPSMYIGGVDSNGLHHLAWEILDNSIDEAMNGHASAISLTLSKDQRTVTVSDDGRGIPVDTHAKTGKSALETILCTLHSGGKFERNSYRTSGGLHGVGASVVNALSEWLHARVKRDGAAFELEFSRGKPKGKLKNVGPARGSGTTIAFRADEQIFSDTRFNAARLCERMEVASYLHRGVSFHFSDEGTKKDESFTHAEGLADYLKKLVVESKAVVVHAEPFLLRSEAEPRMEMALVWTESTAESVKSYVNGIPTGSGGTHENGLRTALLKALRNVIETHNMLPRGVELAAEDIREGITVILSLFVEEPQFQGQTKDRLNNPEVQALVEGRVRQDLEHWLNHNRSTADCIVARIILASRARAASRAASQEVKRKTSARHRLNLPGKLADCISTDGEETELFLVEGDSAGGSAKQGRDRNFQAILPLRGKVMNVEGMGAKKVLENKELSDLVTALGCNLGEHFDIEKLRYGRVILLADADSDGHHITTLLLTFFYRMLPGLIRAGRLYIAQPPLYRVNIGRETYWAADDADRDRILANNRGKAEITRFKGLGEMMAATLWETTLDPAQRRLLKVEITEPLAADKTISELMGRDASARFDFVMNRAESAEALDL
ncbi:MAG: type IIA DNA topoisomerase subunit B [Planctomycetes bacterium]|nr:type IIA DNA topoisomerase subunit B [Planctomycetota bacterium]